MLFDWNSSHAGQSGSIATGPLRLLGLCAVFALVVFGFWKTNERTLTRIQAGQAIQDDTGTLSAEDKSSLRQARDYLSREYGLNLRVRATDERLDLPDADAQTLFIGVEPAAGRSAIILPPLLSRSLDPTLVAYLTEDHFRGYLEPGGQGWVAGVRDALALILRGLEGGGPEGQKNGDSSHGE
jgi:hypothetical protein